MTQRDEPRRPPRRGHPMSRGAARRRFDVALRLGGLFAAIIVVALIFIAINRNFANLNIGVSVLRSMSSVAIMALGLTLVIVVGEIDLSFGAMYGLAANALAVMWIVRRRAGLSRDPARHRHRRRWSACSTACWSPGSRSPPSS